MRSGLRCCQPCGHALGRVLAEVLPLSSVRKPKLLRYCPNHPLEQWRRCVDRPGGLPVGRGHVGRVAHSTVVAPGCFPACSCCCHLRERTSWPRKEAREVPSFLLSMAALCMLLSRASCGRLWRDLRLCAHLFSRFSSQE